MGATSKRVDLLTARDLGARVAASGYVRFEAPYDMWLWTYSKEVRVEGILEGFEPRRHDPRARVREITPATVDLPAPGFVIRLGGVAVLVPEAYVVTLEES